MLKIVKRNLIEEYPCQNRKQPEKKEGEYIENDKNCLSKCIVGRTWIEYFDATTEHHLEETKGRQIFKQRIFEKYREKAQRHHANKNQIQEHQKNKDRYTEKTLRLETKTEKQWGKHKERDTKEKKIELIPKNGERRKQKAKTDEKEQLLINQ